jgi:PAS domain S-box-containing protein
MGERSQLFWDTGDHRHLLRSIFESNIIAKVSLNTDGQLLLANDAASELFGYSREEFKELSGHDIGIYNNYAVVKQELPNQTGSVNWLQYFRHKDGKTFLAYVVAEVFNDQTGNHLTHLLIVDITEFEKIENYVSDRERYFKKILNASNDLISILTIDFKRKFLSASAADITGYSLDELALMGPFDMIHPDDLAQTRTVMQQVAAGKLVHDYSYRLVKKSGAIVSISASVNVDRTTGNIITIGRDITDNYNSQQQLHDVEARFKIYFDFSSDAMLEHDFEGRILNANEHFCALTGYPRETLLSLYISDIDLDFDIEKAKEAWSNLPTETPIIVNGTLVRREGSVVPVEIQLVIYQLNQKPCYITRIRNVSRRNADQARLLKLNNELTIKVAELVNRNSELENLHGFAKN